MTRDEAKEFALKLIDEDIEKYGEDAFFMRAPKTGKNSWTFKEAKESVIKDKCLEDSNTNPIDMILEFEEYAKEHNLETPKL